jgi:purine-binding chemotaxis protein CheW
MEVSRFLKLRMADHFFGISLDFAKEVIDLPEYTTVGTEFEYVLGFAQLREQVITIIDLRKKMSLTPSETLKEDTVVIVQVNGHSLGLVVDSVENVISVEKDQIKPTPNIGSSMTINSISGIISSENHLMVVLNLEAILSTNEIHNLKAQMSASVSA